MGYWDRLQGLAGDMPLIVTGAAGAILRGNGILLVRHRIKDLWQIPGGVQEFGESLEETVKREIKEELNLDVQVEALVGLLSSNRWNVTSSKGSIIQPVTAFYLLKRDPDAARIKIQQEEISDYAYFSLEEIPENTFECCKEKVRMLIKFLKNWTAPLEG